MHRAPSAVPTPLQQILRLLDQGKHFHYITMPIKRNRQLLPKASSYPWSKLLLAANGLDYIRTANPDAHTGADLLARLAEPVEHACTQMRLVFCKLSTTQYALSLLSTELLISNLSQKRHSIAL